MSSEAFQHLVEAEDQIELDEATFQEMDEDSSPDLTPEEKDSHQNLPGKPREISGRLCRHQRVPSTPQVLSMRPGPENFLTYELG